MGKHERRERERHSKESHRSKKRSRDDEDDRSERKKKRRKKEKNEMLLGYSNEDNPFGDSNLTQKFVWKKKADAESRELSDKEAARRERKRRKALEQELQKARERREEREREHLQWEEEQRRLTRDREASTYQDWERKEVEFHLEQAKRRAEIRLAEGRPKPIDVLYKNVTLSLDFDFDTAEPYHIFDHLTTEQLVELREDICMYLELDANGEFWDALLVVCDAELAKHRQREAAARAGAAADGVHAAIDEDVEGMFSGKSVAQLDELEQEVGATLRSGSSDVDVEFWEGLLRRLRVHRAKTLLRQMHSDLLRKRLLMLKKEQEEQQAQLAHSVPEAGVKQEHGVKREGAESDSSSDEDEDDFETAGFVSLEGEGGEPGDGGDVLDAAEAEELLRAQRQKVMEERARRAAAAAGESDEMDARAREQMIWLEQNRTALEEGEEEFGADDMVTDSVYSLDDKFRPRKPKYFNRVKTGYEWNKYNQTHYDHDNPPPKVVQGYKFNVFYPDLIDKSQAPTFFLEKTDNPDTVLLRFHAGPPYEDIAFKIVNRAWEYSHKHGYKCVFDRGVLQLWFNFVRMRYRR